MEDDNVDLEGRNSPQQSMANNLQAGSTTDPSQAVPSLGSTTQVQSPISGIGTNTSMPSTFSGNSSPQGPPPNGATQKKSIKSIADIDKKIKFWKKLSLAIGLIAFFGYIFMLIGANVLAHETQFGWVVSMVFSMAWYGSILVLFILSLTSLIRVIVLSSQRKKHVFKDYVMVVIGLLLIFSPYAISGISMILKSKDPYYLSGDFSWGDCARMRKIGTSNDLKDIDIDDKYSYVDSKEGRKLFAAKDYIRQIGAEIICQVGEFYREEGRYPNETEIEYFSSNAINDDVRAGVYNIKLEVGAEPNNKDFTILFDKNCTNKTAKDGNIVVLSPLYGDSGRYCVHQTIDNILLENFPNGEV